MENEITPTPQAPIIPPEIIKPKKKILLLIIIGIIFVLLIGFIFYQQKQITKKTIVSGPIPTPTGFLQPEPTRAMSPEYLAFYTKLKSDISTLCPNTNVMESKDTLEGGGFLWIEENKDINLILGDSFSFYFDQKDKNEELCFYNVWNANFGQFDNSKKNSVNGEIEGLVRNSEGNSIKCQIIDISPKTIDCGEIIGETPPLYKEMYPVVFPNYIAGPRFYILKAEANYVKIGTYGTSTTYKKINGVWTVVMQTFNGELGPNCEIVFKNNIPPSLVDDFCYYFDTSDLWNYNHNTQIWEKSKI